MEQEVDRRIVAVSAVMQALNRSVVVKKELSRKAKLSIYRSIYVPTLTYGHELWVMTERTRSQIQAAEKSFLRRVAGLSLRDEGEELGHPGGTQSRAAAPARGEEPAEVAQASAQDAFWKPPVRGVPDMSHREEASWPTQDQVEGLYLSPGLGMPGGPSGGAGGSG